MNTFRNDGSFRAVDSTGRVYVIGISTEMIDGEIEGVRYLKTSDGRHVNRIERGKYLIAAGKIDLTSDDPTAP